MGRIGSLRGIWKSALGWNINGAVYNDLLVYRSRIYVRKTPLPEMLSPRIKEGGSEHGKGGVNRINI